MAKRGKHGEGSIPGGLPCPAVPIWFSRNLLLRPGASVFALTLGVVVGVAGLTSGKALAQSQLGSSFDCARDTAPMITTLCRNEQVRRTDLEQLQKYYTFRHAAPDLQQEARTRFIAAVRRLRVECDLPVQSQIVACVTRHLTALRESWLASLRETQNQAALEEARLSPDQLLALQAALQEAGYIPSSSVVDGVYGTVTRSAISQLQADRGIVVNGFATVATLQALRGGSAGANDQRIPAPLQSQAPATPADTDSTRRGSAAQQVREYSNREKTLLEEIMNYTTFGNIEGFFSAGTSAFWVSGHNNEHECVLTMIHLRHEPLRAGSADERALVGFFEAIAAIQANSVTNRHVDIRRINQTAFRLHWRESVDRGRVQREYWAADENTRISVAANIIPERFQNAWGLAFRECPGQRSRF